MNPFDFTYGDGCRIQIGYRTPGMAKEHDEATRVDLAVELGMPVIEPAVSAGELCDVDAAKRLKEAADAKDVAIPSVGCLFEVTTPGADVRKAMEEALPIVQATGAGWVYSRAKKAPPDVPQAEIWEMAVAGMQAGAKFFGDAGIKFAIEADGGNFIHTLERQVKLIKLVNHPNFYPNFDPMNLYISGSDPLEAVEIFGSEIQSMHIKDGIYRGKNIQEMPVGEGELDYPAIFSAIMGKKLSVRMFIEHCKQPDQVRKAAEHIRGVVTDIVG